MLHLVVLGAGCALPQENLGPAGYAVRGAGLDGVTLFDCGPGSVRALAAAGIGLAEVRRVLISHFHTDHVLDLFALFFARRNPHLDTESLPPLEVIGPVGLVELVARWGRAPTADLIEVEPGQLLCRGAARLRSVAVRHSPEALAWRLDLGGVSVTYSGDTGECEALVELARGTQLLIADCSFSTDEPPNVHMNAAAAARTAAAAGASTLLLSHFYPHVDPVQAAGEAELLYAGRTLTASDGMRISVGAGKP